MPKSGPSSGWDDDDWVGTPPEGHHSADKADPDFWRGQRAPQVALGAVVLIVVILILAAALS